MGPPQTPAPYLTLANIKIYPRFRCYVICVISHLQVISHSSFSLPTSSAILTILGFQVELHNIKSHVLPPGYLVFNQPKWYFAMFSDCLNADIWFSMDQVGSQHSEQVSQRGHLLLICFLLIGTSLLLLCTALTLVSEPCFCHEGPCRGCQYLYWDLATANDGVPASVNTTLPPPSRPPLVSIFSKQLLIALLPIYNCDLHTFTTQQPVNSTNII